MFKYNWQNLNLNPEPSDYWRPQTFYTHFMHIKHILGLQQWIYMK